MMQILILFAIATAIFFYLAGPLKELARHRLYKSGTGWCFWRWTDTTSEYILRLHVVKTPWFAVCLHWINKPDREPWLHDHPVSFLSCILRGQYAELRKRGDGKTYIKVNRWFNFIRASEQDKHRIMFVRKGTLTLCFMGPKRREWGFHRPEGWIGWKAYYAEQRSGSQQQARSQAPWPDPALESPPSSRARSQR